MGDHVILHVLHHDHSYSSHPCNYHDTCQYSSAAATANTASSSSIICRICHEEEEEAEFESLTNNLEAPCACSGTVKFAHRDCIQRWCNEKGNTICELCFQKFEPGYTAAPPKNEAQLIDSTTPVTGRRSSEGETRETEHEIDGEEMEDTTQSSERSSAAETTASYCRSVALIFTGLLLMRHMVAVISGRTGDYPFTLLTLLTIRACGILLPMYILVRLITAIQHSSTPNYEAFEENLPSFDHRQQWG